MQAGEEFCCFRSAREVQIIIAAFGRRGLRQQDVAAGWDGEGETDGDLLIAIPA